MKTRITQLTVVPEGEPIYSEEATHIRLEDEAAGEFIVIAQDDTKVRIDPNEWHHVRDAVERLLGTAQPEPYTFEAQGHTWTRHKPGDPVPCDPSTKVRALMRSEIGGRYQDSIYAAGHCDWSSDLHPDAQIIGWARA